MPHVESSLDSLQLNFQENIFMSAFTFKHHNYQIICLIMYIYDIDFPSHITEVNTHATALKRQPPHLHLPSRMSSLHPR